MKTASAETPLRLHEYYAKEDFNPCYFRVRDQAEYERHFAKRVNLYVNKLRIPQLFWKDRDVLEVGPGVR